jgi:hypothetical protein
MVIYMTKKIVISVLVVVVVAIGGYMLFVQPKTAVPVNQDNSNATPTPTPSQTPSPTPGETPTPTVTPNPTPTPNPTSFKAPTLALSPSASDVAVGSKFDVKLWLDTAGKAIDGVDIYQLHFDPALLSLTATAGTLMPINAYNKIENGTFTFSQLATGGTHYTGAGTLVTLHFTALKAGTANVTMDFTAGAANKSNIAGGGKNILQQVVNGKYTIK